MTTERYIHTIMVYTRISVAAVLPKETVFFGTRRHKFRFVQLNALTAQIKENKIDFRSPNSKFPFMTTERLYSYNNGKYLWGLWGGCFTQGSLLFWHKASYVPLCPIKCINFSDLRNEN